jgi:ubiquinol-cytochrome c reductase cytochrome b subunit
MAVLVVVTINWHGGELGPPADPSDNFSAARPEWFFLPLYQFLKFFPGGTEIVGAMVIPGLFFALVFVMPFTARRRWGPTFNICLAAVAALGAGTLLWRATAVDRGDAAYQAARRQLKTDAARIEVLARSPQGIPATGPLTLLRHDPQTQGPRLFARYCASCHRYDGHNGLGAPVADKETASDLKGFGSRAWLAGLLNPAEVSGPHYFGGTTHQKGKMSKFVKTKVSAFAPAQQADLRKVIAAVSAEAHLPAQKEMDAAGAADIAAGADLFRGEINCADCHQLRIPDANADAPDLTGWASRSWLISIISNPGEDRFYGAANDRMPAFLGKHILDEDQIALLADWLRGD